MPSDFLNTLRPEAHQALLLKAALLSGEPARTAFAGWRRHVVVDEVDGPSFRLLPLLAANLGRLEIADPDLPRFRGVRRQQLFRNRTMLHGMKPVLQAMVDAGIPVMFLKGAAICASVRRDWSLRHMADVDILVPGPDALPAWRVFERHGWRVERAENGHATDSPEDRIRYLPNVSFHHDNGLAVDLHWRSLWQREHTAQETAFWQAAVEVECDAVRVRVPAAGHQLLFVLAHAALSFSHNTLDWIADAHGILGGDFGTVDWDEFVRFGRQRGLSRILAAQLQWLHSELGCPVPAKVLQELGADKPRLLEFVIRGQRLGSFSSLWLASETWSDPKHRSIAARVREVIHALSWYYDVPFTRVVWLLSRKALARSGNLFRGRTACQSTS